MPEKILRSLFDAAVAAAQAETCVAPYLPPRPKGRTIVIGAGKASATMAREVEDNWDGDLSGIVITPYGHGVSCRTIEVVEAAHPVPDEAGRDAARRILESVQGLSEDDLVLFLVSGGGSALLALPAPGLTLEDKQAVNSALLKSGANISEMNCVRKHLSAIKGGRLAAAAVPAEVVTLAISDVPGDDLAVIASGPTVPDPTTYEDARAVLEKYGLNPPASVMERIVAAEDETPKPDDPRFARTQAVLVATPQMALEAAAKVAREAGLTALIMGDSIEGEARDVAQVFAGIARQVTNHGQPAGAPCVLLSGGETTVSVKGTGRGGRNAEFLLAMAVALGGQPGIWAIACDTDGIDGTEKNAGCLLRPDTLARAEAKGVSAKAMLANNDGYSFFDAVGGLVVTGPTLTNVNDFRAILIEA
jgi:glycerate 2-kinase